jgi:hypothetical protein
MDTLGEMAERLGVVRHAYCLMADRNLLDGQGWICESPLESKATNVMSILLQSVSVLRRESTHAEFESLA